MYCLLGLVKHARACRTFSKITMYRYLREGWELFCWIWPSISKILWNNKLAISLERVEWFCWFFACSYLHLVNIPWSYNNMLFWVGIVRHRLSANQIVRCFKLKKHENCMRWQVDFLLSLKLQKICYFGLWPQNTLGQSVCRIFYFWLVWIVNFNTGGLLLHCTCSFRHLCYFHFCRNH